MEIAERPTDTLLDLTPLAAQKVKELMAEEPDADTLVLRVAIQGGGCSGFQYGLGFDSGAAEGDHELELEGVTVVVDPFSAPYLQGATIDYLTRPPGVRVQDREPERGLLVRLRPLFQVEEGEELPEGTQVGGCGSLATSTVTVRAPRSQRSRCSREPDRPLPRRRRRLRAGRLLRRRGTARERGPAVEVDLIERLPTPWGLVRLGVAPDHPEHQGRLARVREDRAPARASASSATSRSGATSRTRSSPSSYDAVVYAVGAQTDRRLGIPGEDLPGSWPATAFVAWYNGHPDFQDLEFDLSRERAVVIGNGNVALDVARMLALTPRGARADRHDRRGDRGDRRLRASARSSCSAAAGPCRPP